MVTVQKQEIQDHLETSALVQDSHYRTDFEQVRVGLLEGTLGE